MKKVILMFSLAGIVSCGMTAEQAKTIESASLYVQKAEEIVNNPEKAAKPSSWMNLGKAYLNSYEVEMGSAMFNMTKQEVDLILNKAPLSSETVEVNGQALLKETYEDRALYYNAESRLVSVAPLKKITDDPLLKAANAYSKAYELDPKKDKDVKEAMKAVYDKCTSEALNLYSRGDLAGAGTAFERAAEIMERAPLSQLDTSSLYNAGYIAYQNKDKEKAGKLLKKCYENGYYSNDGSVYAMLSDIYPDMAKKYLEEGFAKYPQSQSIMISLINYYVNTGEDTETLFSLLDKAKANEPNNASLWYVEGNVRAKLNQLDKAVEAYKHCAVIDPNYEYGYIGMGQMYYDNAIKLQEKAQNELDDTKYAELTEQLENSLKNCLEPFEKAYSISKNNTVKVSIAEYLKNVYFRFRESSPDNQKAYEKYAKIVETKQAE